jgi:hypothetical protein
MISKKLLALLTLSALLTGWMPIARAEDIDHDGEEDHFVELKTGEAAAEDGYFFTVGALSKIISKQEAKLAELTVLKDTEIKKVQLELETVSKKKELELTINKEMYEKMLIIKQDRIDQLSSAQKWSDWKLVGGFVLGLAASIAMFYAAVQVTR